MHRLSRFVQEVKTFQAAESWTQIYHWFKSVSASFDAVVGRLLNTLLMALANSSLRRHAPIEHFLRTITAGHDASDLWDRPEFADEIVTHPAATVSPRFAQSVARSARVGFVGLAIVVVWWSWPSGGSPAAHSSARSLAMGEPRAQATSTTPPTTVPLAIVNPANQAATQTPLATEPRNQRQPAFVSMPSLAGLNAGVNPADDDAASDAAPVVDNPAILPGKTIPDQVMAEAELPAVLPVDAELAEEFVRSEEIVVIAAAPQGATESFLVPTPAGSPTPTPDIPFVKIITVPGFTLPQTGPTATPTPTATATPIPIALAPGRLWSNFVPKPASESTHFWIDRAFPDKIASPNYQFGSTAGGRYRIHHGVDTSQPMGTPVRAAVSGEVVHAGWDDPDLLGPYGGFYGNAVVIRLDRRLPVAGGELDVFVLYGHLSQVTTSAGARVDVDDIVGNVGMTGIAIGPHLHTEVRLGANSYEQSVNPYLWVKPANNGGAVAVRLLSSDGRTWPGARLTLARFEGSKAVWARQIELYQSMENIGPDPAWGENGAMGSVPPGRYYIIGRVNGESIRAEIDVRAGETTFVELRTEQ
jgi:murein DD-endopeptidase MepM/ murein hydrolase activator NlpD